MKGIVSAADWVRKHVPPESAKELGAWMKDTAKELAQAAAKNLADATPLTRDGMARGLATMAAELRGGLLDAQRAVVQAFPDSQQQETVLGMIGVPTPGMVDRASDLPIGVEIKPSAEQQVTRTSILGYPLAQEPAKAQERDQSRGM
jgi:hypothetical protein